MNKTAQEQGAQGTLVDEGQTQESKDLHAHDSVTDFSPGQSDTQQEDSEQLTQGQEGYPGYRPEGINQLPGLTPAAGDVDPDDTRSAHETGQDGDTSKLEKKKAFNYF